MVDEDNGSAGKEGFHSVKDFLHGGGVVLIFVVDFAEDIKNDQGGIFLGE